METTCFMQPWEETQNNTHRTRKKSDWFEKPSAPLRSPSARHQHNGFRSFVQESLAKDPQKIIIIFSWIIVSMESNAHYFFAFGADGTEFLIHFELSRSIRIFTRSFCTDNYLRTKYPPNIAKLECFGGAPRTRVVAPRLRRHLNEIAPFFHQWIVCIEYYHRGKSCFFSVSIWRNFPSLLPFSMKTETKH